MTKPTPEQIQRACTMLGPCWSPDVYGRHGSRSLTALADTIAELDDMRKLAKDFEATVISLKAERDKARADLREIDRLLEFPGTIGDNFTQARAIAAPFRVETDPVDDLINAIAKQMRDGPLDVIWHELLRAELAKRGLEIGRSA